ncbi:uncharacterized protein BKCO1_19000171 [Diplodia corticola]|uniref:DUF6590 domain-containing protein n=1 Tax=Diplodia corticola TaxID=236234 RepID=A0A1J9R0S9_9PEZI|nr:uncharacterized protein BKCO1_19000171 [Diplodia corticola]OJD34982.1 hypothetical protein BKCO1_19000171 [Diplodia corticola]
MQQAQQTVQWQYDFSRQDYYYFDPTDNCYVYQNLGRVYPEQYNNAQGVLTSVEGGPAEQMTEPRALQSGIRAHRRVRGGAGDAERLDPRFVKHTPGRDFYKVGKVFKVLWPEPAGNAHAGATFVTGAFNEPIYNKIRWFVVIREGRDCCTCLSIQTYNRQGVAKPGVDKTEHSIMYTGPRPPQIPEWEDPYGEMLQAIPVVATDPTQAKMDVMSRLNYAKPYTVEHNVKSLDFGDVAPGWTDYLRQNFLSVLQRDTTEDGGDDSGGNGQYHQG